jgi:hypothetical protein
MSYRLGLGGISDTSTGSNSNLGSDSLRGFDNAALSNPREPLARASARRSLTRADSPYFAMSYRLGLGGISDTSTGSNSNLGSSASGAKYAFVVFSQFASSRSGKSGL